MDASLTSRFHWPGSMSTMNAKETWEGKASPRQVACHVQPQASPFATKHVDMSAVQSEGWTHRGGGMYRILMNFEGFIGRPICLSMCASSHVISLLA